MVKGTKRKIPIEKITKKNSVATCFTKRRDGLYSKASQLCLLSDAQIAIIATPSSSQSNVSFFSFGHSSVDAVVSAYLAGKRLAPVDNKRMRQDIGVCLGRKDLGLGFWWEDEALYRSENLEELKDAVESMKILFRDVKKLMGETLIPDDCLKTDGDDDDDQNERNCFGECSNQDKDLSNCKTLIHDDFLKTDTEMVVLDDDQNLKNFNNQEKDVTDYDTNFESWLSDGFQDIAASIMMNCEAPVMETTTDPNLFSQEEQEHDHICLRENNNNNSDALSAGNYLNECSNQDHQLIDCETLLSDGVSQSFREFDGSLVMNCEARVLEKTDPNLLSEEYALSGGNYYLNECSNEEIDQLIDYESLLSEDVMQSFREFDASHMMNSEDDVTTDPNLFSDEAYVLQHLSCDVFDGLDTVVFDE